MNPKTVKTCFSPKMPIRHYEKKRQISALLKGNFRVNLK